MNLLNLVEPFETLGGGGIFQQSIVDFLGNQEIRLVDESRSKISWISWTSKYFFFILLLREEWTISMFAFPYDTYETKAVWVRRPGAETPLAILTKWNWELNLGHFQTQKTRTDILFLGRFLWDVLFGVGRFCWFGSNNCFFCQHFFLWDIFLWRVCQSKHDKDWKYPQRWGFTLAVRGASWRFHHDGGSQHERSELLFVARSRPWDRDILACCAAPKRVRGSWFHKNPSGGTSKIKNDILVTVFSISCLELLRLCRKKVFNHGICGSSGVKIEHLDLYKMVMLYVTGWSPCLQNATSESNRVLILVGRNGEQWYMMINAEKKTGVEWWRARGLLLK